MLFKVCCLQSITFLMIWRVWISPFLTILIALFFSPIFVTTQPFFRNFNSEKYYQLPNSVTSSDVSNYKSNSPLFWFLISSQFHFQYFELITNSALPDSTCIYRVKWASFSLIRGPFFLQNSIWSPQLISVGWAKKNPEQNDKWAAEKKQWRENICYSSKGFKFSFESGLENYDRRQKHEIFWEEHAENSRFCSEEICISFLN